MNISPKKKSKEEKSQYSSNPGKLAIEKHNVASLNMITFISNIYSYFFFKS